MKLKKNTAYSVMNNAIFKPTINSNSILYNLIIKCYTNKKYDLNAHEILGTYKNNYQK